MSGSFQPEDLGVRASLEPAPFHFRLTGLQLASLAMAWALSPVLVAASFLAFDSFSARSPEMRPLALSGTANAGASAASATKVSITHAAVIVLPAAEPFSSKQDLQFASQRTSQDGALPAAKSDSLMTPVMPAAKADRFGALQPESSPQDSPGDLSLADIVGGTSLAAADGDGTRTVAANEASPAAHSVVAGAVPQ